MKKLALVVGVLMVVGCGADTDGMYFPGNENSSSSGNLVCTPGKTEECPCPGGSLGAQSCNDSGTKYLECQCSAVNGSGGNDSSSSSTDGNGGNDNNSSSSFSSSSGACIPKSKEEACVTTYFDQNVAMNCSEVDDGCGNSINCGSCSGKDICGGLYQSTNSSVEGVCGPFYRYDGPCGDDGSMRSYFTIDPINDFAERISPSLECYSLIMPLPSQYWCCKY